MVTPRIALATIALDNERSAGQRCGRPDDDTYPPKGNDATALSDLQGHAQELQGAADDRGLDHVHDFQMFRGRTSPQRPGRGVNRRAGTLRRFLCILHVNNIFAWVDLGHRGRNFGVRSAVRGIGVGDPLELLDPGNATARRRA